MRKPTLSPTRLSTYLACPVMYRWHFVDKRYLWFVRAKPYYSFGLSLHNALQRFHDSNDLGVQTTAEAVSSLEENWMSAGYSSPEEAAEALAEGRVMVEGYIEALEEAPSGATTLFTEKDLQLDMGDWVLSGRIYRIDEREDGAIDIIDYKSGSIENPLYDIAMGCYALLVRPLFPDKPIYTTLISLKTRERVSELREPPELAGFEKDLRKLAMEILNRDYPTIDPKAKALCVNCDFLRVCATVPDFAEDFSQFGEVSMEF
ncbi:MAG: PD-(D/E)XK nuclease family protein [Fimbriimonadales bacterium]